MEVRADMALRRTLLTSAARAQEIFCDLLDLPAAQRETAARRRCRTDDAVRTEVLRLLRLAEPARGAFEPPPMVAWRSPEDEIGRVVGGRWWLDRLIGGGGSGDVYEAHDCRGEQRAALKLVRGLSRDGTHAVRREIALLRWLRIPGVVRLIDDGAEHGAVFCVMDLLDGLPFPGKRRSRSWDDLEAPALSLLEAVAGVHEAGVVHCDLKPRNVLVDARGRLTILDLGISAETRHSYGAPRPDAPQATPAYASPEQLRGGETDPRWDLYAIGVMLFESLAGRHPDGPPRRACERLAAPPAVRRTVASLLAPLPGSRPRSARDVIETLRPSARTPRSKPW